jgi:hypothetical protein
MSSWRDRHLQPAHTAVVGAYGRGTPLDGNHVGVPGLLWPDGQALKDVLPVDEALSVSTVRTNALAVAQRCEAELGDEQMSLMDGCPRDWGHLSIPDGPITVGIDGGYVRDWDEQKGHFEVIVGKSISPSSGRTRRISLPAKALALSRPLTCSRNDGCSRCGHPKDTSSISP